MILRKKVIIIAEAGVNHNGSLSMAYKLPEAASKADPDYIKFQIFKSELNISKSARKANYQIENTNNKVETQFEMVKKLELSFNDFKKIKEYCDKLNIGKWCKIGAGSVILEDIPDYCTVVGVPAKIIKVSNNE